MLYKTNFYDPNIIALYHTKNNYDAIGLNENGKKKNNLCFSKGNIYQSINLKSRDVCYIAGPSGSGKTTYAKNLIESYKYYYPDNNIFVFSRLSDDSSLQKLLVKRITPEILGYDTFDIMEMFDENDLIMFDDVETIQDDKIKKNFSKIKNDILETGRHKNLYIIVTCHLINSNEKKDSRIILNEAKTITFFPKSGSTYQIQYLLKNYLGLSNNQIKEILNLPSRWVTIAKNYPQYILYDKGVLLI